MPYKLSHDAWLSREVVRARATLLVHLVDGQEYTVTELIELLKKYGLDYSNPVYTEIGASLLAEGFLETT